MLRNTPLVRTSKSWLSRHPWLKNSRDYGDANTIKLGAKKNFIQDPSELNRDLYRRATFLCSDIYERERALFIAKAIDDTRGNTHEFYSLMKNGSKTSKETPESMLSNGIYVKDEAKLTAFATQLSSCFLQDAPLLGTNFSEINEKLYEIYQINFSENFNHNWADFDLKITPEIVLKLINELKISKDPGPMQIPALFLQYNSALLAPIISNEINSMILTGRIPDDWKIGFITPIPKKGSPI